MMAKVAVRRERRREKGREGERRKSGKALVANQTADMTERASTLKCLSVGSTRARRSGYAGRNPK
jgi:hypothetical protein